MSLTVVLLLVCVPEQDLVKNQISLENLIRESSHPDINAHRAKQNMAFVLPPRWKAFPGFTATVRVRLDDREELGKVIVSPCGCVYVEHLTEESKQLVKRSLGTLVRLRLGKGDVLNNGILTQTKVIPNRLIQVRQTHWSGETLWTWILSNEGQKGDTHCRKSEILSWTRKKGENARSELQSILWKSRSGFDLPATIRFQSCPQPGVRFRYELEDVILSGK